MPMTPEERRKRDRERKRRQRQAASEKPKLSALPQIGRGASDDGGTQGGTSADEFSNESAARDVIAGLEVPQSAKWRVALIMRLARDLDAPSAIPQRAGLAARYTENLEALVAAVRPRESDELDEMRRRFYTGSVDGIDDDPEAPVKRPVRKKA